MRTEAGPAPGEGKKEPARERVLSLARSHPDWTVSRVAEEAHVSETLVRKILRKEGLALITQWKAKRRRGVRVIESQAQPTIQGDATRGSLAVASREPPRARGMPRRGTKGRHSRRRQARAVRLDRRSMAAMRGLIRSVKLLSRTSSRKMSSKYSVAHSRPGTELVHALGPAVPRPDRSETIVQLLKQVVSRLDALNEYAERSSRPALPSWEERALAPLRSVRDILEADYYLKAAGLPGLSADQIRAQCTAFLWVSRYRKSEPHERTSTRT